MFPAIFVMLLEVRAFEADQFAWLNFSLIEVRRGVQALAAVVSVWQSADALQQMFTFAAATNVFAHSLIFCMLCGAIGTGGNG